MKIVVFGPERRVGVLTGELVVDVAPDLLRFIEAGDAGLQQARSAVAAAGSTADPARGVHRAADVALHAPHVPGSRIACAGGNFADHAAAMSQRGSKEPAAPVDLAAAAAKLRAAGIWGFWKVGRDAAGPDAEVPYPARTQRLDYEGELAIVLGKTVTDAKAADLKPCIWGLTLFADWSIRDGHEPAAPLKFGMSKNFNGSFSIGPCIVTGESLDEANIDVETWVNGERRQRYNTRDMIVSFGEYLEYLSADFTFYPGDMITGGTAAGTAADSSPRAADGTVPPDRFLKAGDRVEIRSPAVGTLVTRFVAKRNRA